MRAKRLFDVTLAVVGVVVFWPLFVLIAFLIKMGGRGPVFFRQDRVGEGGRTFRIWKFRTMAVESLPGPQLTIGRDARITPVGRWLRRSHLDELPQLFNVLTGEMSLVGPRPEVPRFVELYDAEQQRVLEIRPGMTDPASIRYRRESELLARATDPERFYVESVMPEKIQLNLEYARGATVWSDVRILLRTLAAVVS